MIGFSPPAHANWSLNDDNRRAFLEYYAPIILKRGNEDEQRAGRDWLTNYDFDRDFSFADNKREWLQTQDYVNAAASGQSNPRFEAWQIRPTLYASLIEYMDGGTKNLVLLYQVYNAINDSVAEPFAIHDYERIEIHIRNVSTSRQPGSGEQVNFAVMTQHSRSVRKFNGDPDMNFYTTSTGKHLLVWQAQWSEKLFGPHGHELRFVEDTASRIFYEMTRDFNAEAEIVNSSGDKNVHYIFVPESSATAVSAFNANKLTYLNASSLASRRDTGDDVRWSQVKRITYELQDMADIIPTSWRFANFSPHWTGLEIQRVQITEPVEIPREGTISTGVKIFNTGARDVDNGPLEENYLGRTWFWGVYEIRPGCSDPCVGAQLEFRDRSFNSTDIDSRGRTRTSANGVPGAAGNYWVQHDYFVHSGVRVSQEGEEDGFWLTQGWHLASNGGFDGRWVQLFDDRPEDDFVVPLSVSLTYPAPICRESGRFTARARGGQPPYTFTWKLGGSIAQVNTGVTSSTYNAFANIGSSVELRDGTGAVTTRFFTFNPSCGGPGGGVLQ